MWVYNFVIQDGKIYIGTLRTNQQQTHADITTGRPVQYAGQITFGQGKTNSGKITSWNNASGHYKPEPIKQEWSHTIPLPSDKFTAVTISNLRWFLW